VKLGILEGLDVSLGLKVVVGDVVVDGETEGTVLVEGEYVYFPL